MTASIALIALLSCTAPAGAATDPLAAGKTRIRLDAGLLKRMAVAGVEWGARGRAELRGRLTSLAIVGGTLDPGSGDGGLELAGTITIRAGKHGVALRKLVLSTTFEKLTAQIGKRRLTLAKPVGVKTSRHLFATDLSIRRLVLTGRAAKLLNGRLGVRGVFVRGGPLGSSISHAMPQTITLTGGGFQLALDGATRAKLGSLGVEIAPFEAAAPVDSDPLTYSFPLLNGALAPDLSSGGIGSETGLRLYQDERKTVLSLLSLGISLESRALFAGMDAYLGPSGEQTFYGIGPICSLDTSKATGAFSPQARKATYAGARALMSPALAGALNDTFAKPKGKGAVFSPGEALGVVGFDVQAQ